MIQVEIEHGLYSFKLDDILKEKGISINKLMRETNTDFKVIKRIINGDSLRLDIEVLARLCNYFNCTISDIVDYTLPNSNALSRQNEKQSNQKIS